MQPEKVSHFRKKLEAERELVERELETVGRKNPDVASDWEPQVKEFDTLAAEPEERAEKFGELDNNESILNPLELQLRDIKRALHKMETGLYGICEISGDPIEEARLEANPSARTCTLHMDAQLPL